MAIEEQVPVIPTVIPYNWIILPDGNGFVPKWRKAEVYFEKPIETKGMTLEDKETLKMQVYNVINEKLKELLK